MNPVLGIHNSINFITQMCTSSSSHLDEPKNGCYLPRFFHLCAHRCFYMESIKYKIPKVAAKDPKNALK
jgi:hypothetical protein